VANVDHLPRERPAPKVAGGKTRRSLRVDVARFPGVARRQAINRRLLARTCASDGNGGGGFGPEDVDILVQIAAERFGGEHAQLRHRAIVALGESRALEAAERLWAIASSPAEYDPIRARALAALAAASPPLGDALATLLARDRAPLTRQVAEAVLAARAGLASGPTGARATTHRPRTPAADTRPRARQKE
jgi:hypothetical protein